MQLEIKVNYVALNVSNHGNRYIHIIMPDVTIGKICCVTYVWLSQEVGVINVLPSVFKLQVYDYMRQH